MKTRIFLAAIMVIGMIGIVVGQERTQEIRTLIGERNGPSKKIDHGGYFGISVGYTQIDRENVMTLGGRAGWLIDHHLTLGIAGKAFMNSIYLDGYWPTNEGYNSGYYLMGGYGGFFLEPILAPFSPIHVSFPILIGGGGLVLNDYTWHDYDWEYDYYEPFDWDSYFVFEPGIEVELNIEKFFRIALGASYRLTSNLHMNYVPEDIMSGTGKFMNGFNTAVTFKFGKF